MISFSASALRAGAVLLALAIAAPAFAAGSGGSGGGASDPNAPVVCRTGLVYDKEKKKCVPKQSLNDTQLFEQGNALALAGFYGSALDVLTAIRNQQNADVLTMIGYSKRKLGAVEEGIAIYHQALAIDPNNVNTREYLGEGYLNSGRVDLAELQLDTIAKICGTDCKQYRMLEKAIAGEPVWH